MIIHADLSATRVPFVPYIDPLTTQSKLQEAFREMKRDKRFNTDISYGRLTRSITTAPMDHPGPEDEVLRTGYWKFNSSSKTYICK
jgi:hypothetical protein